MAREDGRWRARVRAEERILGRGGCLSRESAQCVRGHAAVLTSLEHQEWSLGMELGTEESSGDQGPNPEDHGGPSVGVSVVCNRAPDWEAYTADIYRLPVLEAPSQKRLR